MGKEAENNDNERANLCYTQNAENFRSLNTLMWQVPVIAMTLTGGLWYSVLTAKELTPLAARGILIFSSLADLGLALVLVRIRNIMEGHLISMESFFTNGYPRQPNHWLGRVPVFRSKVVMRIFVILLVIAASFSICGVVLLDQLVSKSQEQETMEEDSD